VPEVTRERWDEVYRQSFPRVFRALVATLLNAETSRDALQQAFLIGLEYPPQDTNPEGWLYRVALRHARRPSRILVGILPRSARTESDEHRLLQRLEVGQLLLLLTERQRSIVVAHYYLGFTQVEIASLLNISRGTVGATISNALARMRQEASNG
jgi:RNA polymerase sigma factor (sigma-70 family)